MYKKKIKEFKKFGVSAVAILFWNCKDKTYLTIMPGVEIFLTTLSFVRFLRFPQRTLLTLLRLFHCKLSGQRFQGHILFLSSYLCRIKRKDNSSCSACCGHHLQAMAEPRIPNVLLWQGSGSEASQLPEVILQPPEAKESGGAALAIYAIFQ